MFEETISVLQERESQCDFICSDIITETNSKNFYTLNHPKNIVTNKVTARILEKMRFKKNTVNLNDEGLSATEFPTYASISKYFNIPYSKDVTINHKTMSLQIMVDRFYNYYDSKEKGVLLYKLVENIKNNSFASQVLNEVECFQSEMKSYR